MAGSRLIAIANVIVVASGVLSIIPAYSVGAKTMESALVSGDINKIRILVSVMQDGFTAYGLLFLVCFSLLLINAILLWNSAGKKGCQ
jgi:hypothetical protein